MNRPGSSSGPSQGSPGPSDFLNAGADLFQQVFSSFESDWNRVNGPMGFFGSLGSGMDAWGPDQPSRQTPRQTPRRNSPQQSTSSTGGRTSASASASTSTSTSASSTRAGRHSSTSSRSSHPSAPSSSQSADLSHFGGCPFEDWSIRALKMFVKDMDSSQCLEKRELVAMCRTKVKWPLPESTENDAIACRICLDRELDAVLIPCGHQMCSVCSYGLTDCPMCRAHIERRVRTFR